MATVHDHAESSFYPRRATAFEVLGANGILDVDVTDVRDREQPCKNVGELQCEFLIIPFSAFSIGQSRSQFTELFRQPEKRAGNTTRGIGLEISFMNETLKF